MSKMNAPKMEVVRFKEADVIVASGVPTTMSATGWNDGVKTNLILNYGGTDYDYYKRQDLTDLVIAKGQTNSVYTSKGKTYTINQLFSSDKGSDDGSLTSTLTGLTWDADNNRWNTKQ